MTLIKKEESSSFDFWTDERSRYNLTVAIKTGNRQFNDTCNNYI